MNVELYGWRSEHTDAEMPLRRYGASGIPLIYLPSSGGDVSEFECYGMRAACTEWIDAGRVQIVAVDGRGPQHYWNDSIPPEQRVAGYVRFERYLVEELLPWIVRTTSREDLGAVGCSYGALPAANLWLKHADRVRIACGLGGVYGLWHRLDGYQDDDVLAYTPLEIVPRLADAPRLAALRATRGLVLFGAADDPWLPSSERMAAVLREKELPHELEIWPAPADHHERWWREQLPRFLDQWC